MQVKDIMTREVVSVNRRTKISEISKILTEKRIHGLPVIEETGKLAGIITVTDFFAKDVPGLYLPSYINFLEKTNVASQANESEEKQIKQLINATAEDIMTEKCITVREDLPAEELVSFFKIKKYYTFPVLNQSGELVGVITLNDIIKLL